MKESKLGTSSLTRPKMKVDQIWKIRPFFQSAHQADFKNAKIFEKSSFFEKICLRKPARVHWPSDFFVQKVAFDWCMIEHKLKKIVRFVSKIKNLTSKNWVSYSKPHRTSQNDLFRILTEHYLVNIWVPANLFRPDPINPFFYCKKWIFSTVFPHFWTSRFQLGSESLKLWKIGMVMKQMTMESICSWVWRTPWA